MGCIGQGRDGLLGVCESAVREKTHREDGVAVRTWSGGVRVGLLVFFLCVLGDGDGWVVGEG